MAVFEYRAVDVDAAAVAGTVIADSPVAARDVLRERGLTITDVRAVQEERKGTFLARRQGRAARQEVGSFVSKPVEGVTTMDEVARKAGTEGF